MAEGTQHIAVQECVETASHAASGAIETGRGLERACWEKLCRVGVDNANRNASSKCSAARNPNTGLAATESRRFGGRRGRTLVCRIDGVRQHIASLGLASP